MVRKIRISLLILLFSQFMNACNYPGLQVPTPNSASDELRETLAAITLSEATDPPPVPEMTLTVHSVGGELSPTNTSTKIPPVGTQVFDGKTYHYISQPGDTSAALVLRFHVQPGSLRSSDSLPESGLISPGTNIWIPAEVVGSKFPEGILPDCEVINSPALLNFDLGEYINQQGGLLSRYSEWSQSGTLTGEQIIARVAIESSVNPRLLLALIELRSGWVTIPASNKIDKKYPLGFHVSGSEGLYKELLIAATHLNYGYYGWRDGSLNLIKFRDGSSAVPDPRQNSGSIAVINLLARLYDQDQISAAIYGSEGFIQTYHRLFGDPWSISSDRMQIFPVGLNQPELGLPFGPGERWSLTGGPHPSWKTGSPRGALDFAPVTGEPACSVSRVWVTAPAPGVVVRSDRNVVAIDLDGDGFEQTGWVIILMHIADQDRVSVGTLISKDAKIGHPSCQGGVSTGTHFHIARKYNGEWIAIEGPLPFVMDGWQAYADSMNYKGGLIKGEKEIVASPVGPRTSIIVRD